MTRSIAGWWILFVLVVGITLTVRLRLLELPLERDEGEYAYCAQLLMQGIPPYQLAYSMKFPGVQVVNALVMLVFGQTISAVHIGLMIVNGVAIALLFFIGRRAMNSVAGLVAAASYAVLSLLPSVLGLSAHASQFAVAPVLGGILLLLMSVDRQSHKVLFVSGILFGVGLLMKQPAIFFILFGATYLGFRDYERNTNLKDAALRNAVFASGAILPIAVTCLLLWWAGVFPKFWSWTVDNARHYAAAPPISAAPVAFITRFGKVFESAWPLWIIAAAGCAGIIWNRNIRPNCSFFFGFLIFSFAAVCPGFYFREHYFIFALPAVALLVGAGVASANEWWQHRLPFRLVTLVLFAVALAFPLLVQKQLLFSLSPDAVSRTIYRSNPFPESIRVAEYLRQQTESRDTIAILGSEPQIYFYSHRHSATGYIYMYDVITPQDGARPMQQEMIREIEAARPKYVIFISNITSWVAEPKADNLILEWGSRYLAENFVLDGWVNILSENRTDYFLPCLAPPDTVGNSRIVLYRRKTLASGSTSERDGPGEN